MTIYIPNIGELPRKEMAKLGPGAAYSATDSAGVISAHVYKWPDMKVTINVLPNAELAGHLEGLIAWARSVAQSGGGQLDTKLEERLRSTTLVLGFVVDGSTDRAVWHNRVQDMIGMIAYNTGGLVFWEGVLIDENCCQVLPALAEE